MFPVKEKSSTAYLLPNYDEYFIGFKDRSAIGKIINLYNLEANNPAFLANVIIINGQLVGGWKRTLKRDAVIIKLNLIAKLTKPENEAVTAALENYSKFLSLPIELII